MNTDKKIKELYVDVFDEIYASDELLRKVISMSDTNSKKNIRTAVKVLYAVAAVAVLLIASNVIAYAATGSTLLNVIINGEEHTLSVEGEDGIYTYTYGTDSEKVDIIFEGEFSDGDTLYMEESSSVTPSINKEDGKTYLVCDDVKIDITEDMKDGSAEGTFELDGITFNYTVDSDENVMLFYDGAFDSDKDTIEFYDEAKD